MDVGWGAEMAVGSLVVAMLADARGVGILKLAKIGSKIGQNGRHQVILLERKNNRLVAALEFFESLHWICSIVYYSISFLPSYRREKRAANNKFALLLFWGPFVEERASLALN